MGEKGARYDEHVGSIAEGMAADLAPLGDVTWKKMFGGAGLFLDDRMFALIDSRGTVHLKVGDANRARFEAAGCVKHSRMPYYTVPDDVLADQARLLEWAGTSVSKAS